MPQLPTNNIGKTANQTLQREDMKGKRACGRNEETLTDLTTQGIGIYPIFTKESVSAAPEPRELPSPPPAKSFVPSFEEGLSFRMIYLDNNATTPVHPEVLEAMLPFFKEHFHNPSSGYRAAKPVKTAIQTAREQVAALINAHPDEIIFTSCGTESNNTALKSLARLIGRKNSRVITSEIEHSAVLRPIEAMAAVGFDTRTIGVDTQGRFDLEELDSNLKKGPPYLCFADVVQQRDRSDPAHLQSLRNPQESWRRPPHRRHPGGK